VVGELGQLRPEDMTILDMEASIEHLTRGTLREVDILLIVTEPYFRALQTLGRTAPLARELGIPTIYVVANKVRSENDRRAIEEYAGRLDLELIASIPFDDAVQQADFDNTALVDYPGDSTARTAIESLAITLESGPEGIPSGTEAAAAD
jgi:CO dehydrogenase maturation factor